MNENDLDFDDFNMMKDDSDNLFSKIISNKKKIRIDINLNIIKNSKNKSTKTYNDIVNNVYLIDSNLKIIKTGIKCEDLSDIILNGELIYSKNYYSNYNE